MTEKPEDFFKNSEQLSHEIVEKIVEKGSEMLYDNYISTKSIPFTVYSNLSLLASLVEAATMRHEPSGYSIWPEDSEPVASPIDNWARQMIPVITKVKMPQVEPSISFAPDMKSVKSHSSRRSAMTRLGKTSKNPKGLENSSIEEGIIPVPIPQEKTELDEEEENLRQRKEREMKRKKEENERLKKIKDEELDKEKKLLKESEDIKKKLFTYDHNGKIIYVNPVKCENLPENFVGVKYVSQEPVLEEKKQKPRKKSAKDFSYVKRVKTAPAHEREWVKNVTNIQPSLIEVIALNPNVTFVEGNRTKYPPVEKAEDGKTMTRKEYVMTYQNKPEFQSSEVLIDKKSSSISSLDSVKRGHDSKKDIFEIIPDYNELPQTDQNISRNRKSATPARSLTHGRIVQYGAGTKLDLSAGPLEKFNSDILNNRNWGINPPLKDPILIERLPKKPDSRQLREVYGNIIKKPKDDPFISANELWQSKGQKLKRPRDRPFIERVEKKTRMPPPPYGFTMVNALPEINQMGVTGSIKSLNRSEVNK